MDKYIKTAAVAILIAIMATSACKKDQNCSLHPEAFRFRIIDGKTGTDLLGTGVYDIDEIGIFYFFNGNREDLIVTEDTEPSGSYIDLKSAQLPMVSLTRTDIFYLELNSEDTDTLLVVVEKVTVDGCDHHPYTTVRHNGKELPIVEGEAFILEK